MLVRLSETGWLVLLLGATAIGLHLLVVPGVFTVDEDNYLASVLALRAGRLTLPGVDGLPASTALLWFDPVARAQPAPSPVAATAPPLYAILAAPLGTIGWQAFFTLNVIAWIGAAALAFVLARRHARHRSTAWLALGAFMLGTYSVEYAVGAWPHALSMGLVIAAATLADTARLRGKVLPAAAAGLLAGLATGVRYQNAVLLVGVGAGLLMLSQRRLISAAAYAAGAAVPLAAATVLNGLRLGVWNPISKGPGYLAGGSRFAEAPADGPVLDGLRALAIKVVDATVQPWGPTWEAMGMKRWPDSGAIMLVTAVKKALLQSAPWMAVVLCGLALAWRPRGSGAPARLPALRALGPPVVGVLAMFAVAGTARHDGWCHNARYLLEIAALGAVAVAWLAEDAGVTWRPLAAGAMAGMVAPIAVLLASPASLVRQIALLQVPLALAALAGGAWLWARAGHRRSVFAVLLGACLAWSAVAHVGDDLPAAWTLRTMNLLRREAVGGLLPDAPSALLAHSATPYGPLLLDRDLVLADPAADRGATAAALVSALLERGRRVFVLRAGMEPHDYEAATRGLLTTPVGDPATSPLREIRRPDAPAPPPAP